MNAQRTRTAIGCTALGFLAALPLGAQCAATDLAANSEGWFIESYDSGVITVQHEGNTYKAKCEISRSFNNAASVTDENNVFVFQGCEMPIGLVGKTIQPFGGEKRDADGSIVIMWNVGSTLALRSWRDDHTPWRMDEFVITSVTKKPHYSPTPATKSGSEVPSAISHPQHSGGSSADNSATPLVPGGTTEGSPTLDKIYRDESHCLTIADMRGDQDKHTSCFCRDAIIEARYVHFTYASKDPNLDGVFLALVDRIQQQCGQAYAALDVAMRENWRWNGPEVVRTYPSDDIISRIGATPLGGKAVARSVPFTIQLIYRDDKGHVTRTENYSSAEMIPEFK